MKKHLDFMVEDVAGILHTDQGDVRCVLAGLHVRGDVLDWTFRASVSKSAIAHGFTVRLGQTSWYRPSPPTAYGAGDNVLVVQRVQIERS